MLIIYVNCVVSLFQIRCCSAYGMEDDFTVTRSKCGRGFDGVSVRDRRSMLYLRSFIAELVVFALVLTCVANASGMCPAQCECNDLELRASCSNTSLEFVPILFNPDVKHINLSLNKINSIHYTLEFYSRLITIDISYNKIQDLGSSNFQWQRHLNALDLSHNSIQKLNKDVFKGLNVLQVLNLSHNEIESIKQNSFHDLHQLELLNLADNNIVSFEEDLFKHLINLRTLLLDNNQILDIPTSNIKYTHNLEILSLARNLIEYINKDSFPVMRSLKYLSLEMNVISDIHSSSFDGLFTLENLDLSNNNLTKILTVQLSKLSNLTTLNLGGNYFSSIPPVAFRGLFKLHTLRLDRMPNLTRIDQRAFVDNIKLEVVSFDENKEIKTLPTRLFHRNPRLIHISVVDNSLSTLESTHFPLDQLQTLRLGGNPFICNCSLMWLWELERTSSEHNDTFTLDVSRISCAGPDYLTDKLLVLVDESEIRCSMNWMAVAALSTLSTCTLFVVLIVVFYLKKFKCGKDKMPTSVARDIAVVTTSHDARQPPPQSLYNATVPTSAAMPYGYTDVMHRPTTLPDKHALDSPKNEYMTLSPWESANKNLTDNLYQHYNYNVANKSYHSSKPHIVYV